MSKQLIEKMDGAYEKQIKGTTPKGLKLKDLHSPLPSILRFYLLLVIIRNRRPSPQLRLRDVPVSLTIIHPGRWTAGTYKSHISGQIIIFHQPWFPSNKGNSLLDHHLGWGRVRSPSFDQTFRKEITFQTSMIMFHVNLHGCTGCKSLLVCSFEKNTSMILESVSLRPTKSLMANLNGQLLKVLVVVWFFLEESISLFHRGLLRYTLIYIVRTINVNPLIDCRTA